MKQRSDGRYRQKVFVGYDDKCQKKYKYVYGKTKKECNRLAEEVKEKVKQGVAYEDVSLKNLIELWINTKSGLSYRTVEMYQNMSKIILKKFGAVPLVNIRPIEARMFINELISSGKTRQVNQVLLTAKQVFNFAVENQIIEVNPFKGIKPYKYKMKKKSLVDDKEYQNLINSNLSIKEKTFAELIYFSGMRLGEVLALTVDDIDFEKGLIHINKAICNTNEGVLVKEPKSEAGYRQIPIIESFRPRLEEYISGLTSKIVFPMATRDDYMTKSAYRKFWNRIRKVFDDKTITEYSFRHTYATNLIYSGANVKSVQYVMGHSSPDITIGIYTHVNQDLVFDDVQRLSSR